MSQNQQSIHYYAVVGSTFSVMSNLFAPNRRPESANLTSNLSGCGLKRSLGLPLIKCVCLLDPHHTYLLQRWNQGCHNGSQLEAELRAKGYKGSQRAIYRYLATLEPAAFPLRRSAVLAKSQKTSLTPPNPLRTLSVQQATWLFFRRPEDLKKEEQETLRQLRQANPHVEATYQLVETFLQMVRERRAEQFDTWLAALQASGLEAFTSFVTGVLQDKDAVLAGLSLPWSNGPLEGNVNRLKLIKRIVS